MLLTNIMKYNNGLILDFSDIKKSNNRTSWKKSIGKNIYYKYNDISGSITILQNDNGKLLCKNNNLGNEHWINVSELVDGKIVKFIQGNSILIQKYQVGDIIKTGNNYVKILRPLVRIDKTNNKNTMSLYYYVMCLDCKQCYYKISYNFEKTGCPVCNGKQVIKNYNDIPTTAPWMVSYFQGGVDEASNYTKCSGKKIIPICPFCGKKHDKEISINNLYNTHGYKCQCSDGISFPEKFMISFLDQLKIKYIFQAGSNSLKFDTQKKIYDFYIPSLSCIIETHGYQHYYESNDYKMSLIEQIENDRLKYDIAKRNNIREYIVIDCRRTTLDWIKKQILSSSIMKLFNIDENDINWIRCSIDATKNIVKEVCDYYQNNDVNIKELAEIFNLGKKAIKTYLQKGNDNNWCVYKSDHDFFCSYPFKIFKNGKFYCYSKSIKEFSRNSEKIIGTFLSPLKINKYLNNGGSIDGFNFIPIVDFRERREVLYKL